MEWGNRLSYSNLCSFECGLGESMADNSAYGRTKLDRRITPDDTVDLDSGVDAHGLAPKLDDDATHFLNSGGGFAFVPTPFYTWQRFMRTGNDAWYSSPLTSDSILPSNPVIDTLYANPFFVPKTITLDRIAVYVSIGYSEAGSLVELGIYNAGVNMYPGSLLLDAGSVGCATDRIRSIVIDRQLTVGLYWLACLFNVSTLISIKGTRYDHAVPYFGNNLSADYPGESYTWRVAQAYGALPDPFTPGGTMGGGPTPPTSLAHPLAFVRLSVA